MEKYSDEQILQQPIGYWSTMAGRAVVTFIRARLRTHGLTQPQWWVLNYIADRPDGVTVKEVVDYHLGFVDTDDSLHPDTLALVTTGLLREQDRALTITEAGAQRREQAWTDIRKALATIRAGVSDQDYICTIRSLQRMIENVGETAWHA
ncbi:hypothetical protein GCM10027289_26790 [Tsukamurella serpentis]